MKSEKGFTLVELIVAMAIGIMMLMAIYMAVNSAQSSSAGIERRVVAQQDARGALDLMAMEIRMASFNPNLAPNIWVVPSNCTSAPASSAYRGIVVATASEITIEMDLNESSIIGDVENEIITYGYDTNTPANQYIWRETRRQGTCVQNHQPFLGDTTVNEDRKTVLVVNGAAGVPLFRYYDGAGAEIQVGDLPTRIPDIRRIEITLVVDTVYNDPYTGGKKRIVYSTSVIPRNHIPA